MQRELQVRFALIESPPSPVVMQTTLLVLLRIAPFAFANILYHTRHRFRP